MYEYARKAMEGLQKSYTKEEAKNAIDTLLRPYSESCLISFRKKDAEIIDSYLVDSALIRHRVCAILARTGVTRRSYEDLCAEWLLHNLSYKFHFMRKQSRDVSLDYDGDPRFLIRLLTFFMDKLDIE